MEVTQIYIFSGDTYNQQANHFLREAQCAGSSFLLERIEILPGGSEGARIVIVARMRRNMAEHLWQQYLDVCDEG